GRVRFGGLPRVTPVEPDLQPLRLVSYKTDRLSPRERARFLREIDGYKTQKRVGKKTYVVRKTGFLTDAGGWRVGRGAVIVPEEKIEAFDEILRRYGAKRHIIPIWSQRPCHDNHYRLYRDNSSGSQTWPAASPRRAA